jgi:hypothetical protein
MKNNLSYISDFFYSVLPDFYPIQIAVLNGNHFKLLKEKLKNIPTDRLLEIASGTSPILEHFKFKKYVGVDLDNRFVDKAKRKYKNPNYQFIVGDANELNIGGDYDAILLSHATHHFSDKLVKKVMKDILKINFSYFIIYDGKPIGFLSPLLYKLDLGNHFREIEQLSKFFKNNKNYEIIKSEVFRSNRPFYKYPLIIAKRIK